MCGICGFTGLKDNALLKRMIRILAHRGPDDTGYYENEHVSLGHCRLSIIDLAGGHQPIYNEDKSICVVYNGEIYNFPEIKRKLEAKGHKFYTSSDTEILVHLYEEYGEDMAAGLNGIFSFALWDKKSRKLLLARDQFGIKPLYYFFKNGYLFFASEIKALLLNKHIERKLDAQALHYFLNLRFIPNEDTLFCDIKKLPPSSLLTYQSEKIKIKKYWQLKPKLVTGYSISDYQDGIVHYLSQAIKRQLLSDVPVGVYLSGGMDSSSIVALMSKLTNAQINTFCMAFGEPTDELSDAKIIAKRFNTKHHEINIAPNPLKYLPKVIWHAEEPKVNLLQGYLISKFASQYVKAVQGGLGGDELFAGYVTNRFIAQSQPFHAIMPQLVSKYVLTNLDKFIFSLQDKSGYLQWDEYSRGVQMLLSLGDRRRYYLILRNVWDYEDANFSHIYQKGYDYKKLRRVKELYAPYFASDKRGYLDQVLLAEFNTKLVNDFLLNEDRMSMANSLEVRAPFLDKDLVEFAFGIPAELKIKGKHTKYIFKQAMQPFLPADIIGKKKWGFAINPYHQFKKDLKSTAEAILTPKRIKQRGLFNYEYIKKILNYPPHPRMRWHYMFLWMLIGLEIWHQMFIDNNDFENPSFELRDYY